MVALRTPTGPRRSRNRGFGHLGTIRVEIHLNRGEFGLGGRGAIISMIIGVWQYRQAVEKWGKASACYHRPLPWQCISLRGNNLKRKVAIIEAWIKATRGYYAAGRCAGNREADYYALGRQVAEWSLERRHVSKKADPRLDGALGTIVGTVNVLPSSSLFTHPSVCGCVESVKRFSPLTSQLHDSDSKEQTIYQVRWPINQERR